MKMEKKNCHKWPLWIFCCESLTRFSFANNNIKEYINEIVEFEQGQLRKDNENWTKQSVIAEIAFTPTIRISNVIEHPIFITILFLL